jgi:hypothetical protein
MTLLLTQLMKSMKQLTAVASLGLYLIPAAAFLWLVDTVTAPVGGIVFFSAIFTVALAGFASAVVLFHLLARITR